MISLLAALALTCGSEKWAQKTLQDPEAQEVNLNAIYRPPLDFLRKLPAPKPWEEHAIRTRVEHNVYEVTGYFVAAKLESDEDIHIELAELPSGTYSMVAEIPAPHCMVDAPKAAVEAITAVRAKFLALMQVGPKLKRFRPAVRVRARGVLFFDKPHGQTGMAPNGAELHPLLGYEVVQ